MRINPIPVETQPLLFNHYSGIIDKVAARRSYMGLRVEDYVCLILGLKKIKINGNYDINFDAGIFSLGTEIFYEVKSVKKNSSAIIYLWRIEKEKYAAKQNGVQVRYAFCVHSINNIESHEVITKGFISNPPRSTS